MKSIQNYGIFVEIAEGVEGLVHISELLMTLGSRLRISPTPGDKVTVDFG